ncbi:MAG: right-handed parallel beta-helix repeat-containing protein, partial [Chloroflexi bacterium]|nr:right-handed parallel beta-helix repeat-containing protein [Chloroflexota bacterium]
MSRKSTIHFLVSFAIVIGLLFSVLLSMLASAPVRATDVGGQITSDTTWTKANSPYIVTSSVLVNEGVTLTVEPGVTVKFEALKGMLIDGQLVARGTASESITFTSSQTTPAKGDWVNIVFSEKSVDTNLDQGGGYLSGSILEYCTVEYGGASDQAALQFLSGTGTRVIEHCVIRNNASTGLRSQSTTLHVTSCTVSGNFAGGIYASDGQSTISGCTISGNSASYGGGIRGTGGPFTISGCTISTNSAYSGGGIDADGGPFVISDCTISGNSASYGGGIRGTGGPFTISGC